MGHRPVLIAHSAHWVSDPDFGLRGKPGLETRGRVTKAEMPFRIGTMIPLLTTPLKFMKNLNVEYPTFVER
jgi:hypothetical protein